MTSVREAAQALLTALDEQGGKQGEPVHAALKQLDEALVAPPPGVEGVRRRLEELWEDGVNVGLAHEERSAVWETAERDDMLAELLAMWEARR